MAVFEFNIGVDNAFNITIARAACPPVRMSVTRLDPWT